MEAKKKKNENNIIDLLEIALEEFCNKYNIDDIRKESQNIYNAFLMYASNIIYPDKSVLKYKVLYDTDNPLQATNHNIYNYDIINNIIDKYISFTILCDKEVSIYGFSSLLNIDISTIEVEWCNNNKRVKGLTSTAQSLYIKLVRAQEESLSSNLTSGKRNPVGSIAKLNSKFAWNSNGYNRQETAQALGVEELPQLRQIAQTKQDQQ